MGMNIEIANKLYRLRKQNGFSQEELASRLGISRQAVSKWERAEVSPDTDNLIALARLYNISLDELLLGEDRGDAGRKPGAAGGGDGEKDENTAREDASHVSFRGGDMLWNPTARKCTSGSRGFMSTTQRPGKRSTWAAGTYTPNKTRPARTAAGPEAHPPARRPYAAARHRTARTWSGAGADSCVEAIPHPVFACIVFLLWGFWGTRAGAYPGCFC